MTVYVSVNKKIIAHNKEYGTTDPPYELRMAKDDRNPVRVHEAIFTGSVKLVHNPKEPLICGAVCWLEIEDAPRD